MTMTASDTRDSEAWTVDDLALLPDDGKRYELIEGSMLVTPAPGRHHVSTVTRLHHLLYDHAPTTFEVGEGAGVTTKTRDTYFIPDLFVMRSTAFNVGGAAFEPRELLLAVEVLSPGRRGVDLVTKRYHYAVMGIPRYWIVDPTARTVTVLVLDGEEYREEAVVQAGRPWHTDEPFPLDLDPAEFC